MAISQLNNRLKRIDWALMESMKEIRKEADFLTREGNFDLKINPIVGTSKVDVAVFQRFPPGKDPVVSRCVNVTQPRAVIEEMLQKLLNYAANLKQSA